MVLSVQQVLDESNRYKAIWERVIYACDKVGVLQRVGLASHEVAQILMIDRFAELEKMNDEQLQRYLIMQDAELHGMYQHKKAMWKDALLLLDSMNVQKRFGVSPEEATKSFFAGAAVHLYKKDGAREHVDSFCFCTQQETYEKGLEYDRFTPEEMKALQAIIERSPYMRKK